MSGEGGMLEGLKLMRAAGQAEEAPQEAPGPATVPTKTRRQRPPAPEPQGEIPEFGAASSGDHVRRNLNIKVSQNHHDAFYSLYRELVGKGWPVRHADVMEAILGEVQTPEGRARVVRRLQDALAER